MNKFLCSTIFLSLIMIAMGCKSQSVRHADDRVKISGRLLYSPDGSPLWGGVINRASDGNAFMTDDSGNFVNRSAARRLTAFFICRDHWEDDPGRGRGFIDDCFVDPYVPGHDEYVVRQESLYPEMEVSLKTYVHDKDARIGVAVIINGKDTVSVNGKRDFPMLSVYKFPQALAVADYCHKHNISLNDTIRISADDLNPDTWSPMRDKYGRKDISLPLSEILVYSVQQSDNNACDVLFRLIGGPQVADSLMKCLGYDEIHILNTEDEMYRDPYLCYANRATPLQMAFAV